VPKNLSYSTHLVEARAFDTGSGSAVDSVSVTRSRKSKMTLSLQSTATTAYAASGGSKAASGQVLGAHDGTVMVRVQREASGRWATKAVRRVPVAANGAYAASLGRLAGGRWRARALYEGTDQNPPSLPRTRYFKVG
jgi:hypothetical protein